MTIYHSSRSIGKISSTRISVVGGKKEAHINIQIGAIDHKEAHAYRFQHPNTKNGNKFDCHGAR